MSVQDQFEKFPSLKQSNGEVVRNQKLEPTKTKTSNLFSCIEQRRDFAKHCCLKVFSGKFFYSPDIHSFFVFKYSLYCLTVSPHKANLSGQSNNNRIWSSLSKSIWFATYSWDILLYTPNLPFSKIKLLIYSFFWSILKLKPSQ